eukprot:TRINITY_DN6548_c0_g1_i1.p1 TRINITY_DN6548_c0_g1~~TRINITY_DN6548_c0_g1_i1.p1  ORF type:complete len:578 (+),score=109.55 TRINITY_DN6548_c0_g1_i1:481-2214(+)
MEVFVQDAGGKRHLLVLQERDTVAEVTREVERVLGHVKGCTELKYEGVVVVDMVGSTNSFSGLTGITAGDDIEAVCSNAKLKAKLKSGEITFSASSPASMRCSPEIVLLAMERDADLLRHASPSLRGDRDFMLFAVAESGFGVLKHATGDFLTDPHFMTSVSRDERHLDILLHFSKKIVEMDWKVLLLDEATNKKLLPSDPDFCRKATMLQQYSALLEVSEALWCECEEGVCLAAASSLLTTKKAEGESLSGVVPILRKLLKKHSVEISFKQNMGEILGAFLLGMQVEVKHDELGRLASLTLHSPCLVIDFTGASHVAVKEEHVSLMLNFRHVRLKGVGADITDSFLRGHHGLIHLNISLVSPVHIGSGFLQGNNNLRTVTFTGRGSVTSLGAEAFRNCSVLRVVDLSSFENLTGIGSDFLSGCSSLQSVYLSPLNSLTAIRNGFLSFCTSLRSVDLNPLKNVTAIGDHFMSCCEGLETVDLSPLKNVVTIGDCFLSGCLKLESIDLNPLKSAMSAGSDFMSFCLNLRSVDVSSLKGVAIGGNLLLSCPGAETFRSSMPVSLEEPEEEYGKGFVAGL